MVVIGMYEAEQRVTRVCRQYHCIRDQVLCAPTCQARLLAEREANAEPEGWFQKTVAGGGSAALLAFLCNKALLPVRVPITVGLTPVVAR